MPSKFFNVRSADRSSGVPEQFFYQLSTPVKNPTRVSLITVEMPLNIYSHRAPYNYVSFTSGGTQYTATILPALYQTTSALFTALQTAMNATGAGITFSLSVSSSSLKITLTASSSVTVVATPLSNMLGFTSRQSGTSIVATNSYQMSIDYYFLIHIKNLPTSLLGKSEQGTFKLPLQADSTYVQYSLENSTLTQYCDVGNSIAQLAYLDIVIRDSYGNTPSLNGLDWSMLLRVDYEDFELV